VDAGVSAPHVRAEREQKEGEHRRPQDTGGNLDKAPERVERQSDLGSRFFRSLKTVKELLTIGVFLPPKLELEAP
jgi:hypothetical protein